MWVVCCFDESSLENTNTDRPFIFMRICEEVGDNESIISAKKAVEFHASTSIESPGTFVGDSIGSRY
jgi:hypothetical protein